MMNKIKQKIFMLFSFTLLLAGCGNIEITINDGSNTERVEEVNDTNDEISNIDGELNVHFIDVGQGDSILIENNGLYMLIDAGENDQGTNVQNYLQKQGVETLEYVIGTHPDSDHIGGLDVVLYKFDCKTILMSHKEHTTKTYDDVIEIMERKYYDMVHPEVGAVYQFGDASFEVLAPGKMYEGNNNNSIVIMLTHGENKFLLTGDAEEEVEADILALGKDLSADVLKLGHHGSRSSTSVEFLDAVNPEFAVAMCGVGNKYGHPHAQTLNNLRPRGIKMYRTDEQGSLIATSDGKTIKWNAAPDESWKAGEPTENSSSSNKNSKPKENNKTYVLNTKTQKFHLPDCSSAQDTSKANKKTVETTRSKLIKEGYTACKVCNP